MVDLAQKKHPLLIYHGLAGDMLMTTPAFRACLDIYGESIIVVCGTEPEYKKIFLALGFKTIHAIEFKTRPAYPGETIITPCDWQFDVDLALSIAEGCDLVINLCESGGYAFNDLVGHLNVDSVGFHSHAKWYVNPSERIHSHFIDHMFDVITEIDPKRYVGNYAYLPRRPDRDDIASLVREQVGSNRTVAIHADTKLNKMWPIERWAQWLKKLWQHEPETHVFLLGYPNIPLENFAQDERLHDCRDLPLTANYEILALSNQFLGIDSCMIHAADLCRIPSVGIFSEDHSLNYYGLRFADGECLSGSSPPNNISVDDVWNAYSRVKNRGWSLK